ncbi:MAG: 50S ribosomal protein L14 [Candidatus Woesearchaeota archaeon]|jgi:large subunit ribosomal protein L14|nr:50S ribosomal protein L14 [Candidatus Woesearchaeota archaeon]MDP6265538.1 50S ribosomal protein L14 [Candidatus Woesearchaeota archaeon]MDP7322779.1 50S ribosomal protein L14 [Candidatus Woesearchaeota archaeon]MDP7476035.1 50S ribosomal protein L14 [Candidatus Woesearchaeota archaeon]HJO01909.1 50S ribosomal protein L14 [Candidatus Woesearchaeota archaeon]|tara:strand:+ start:7675 stop:8076 length:402 start_codon:yes stop_codon:yes gene_type:complete
MQAVKSRVTKAIPVGSQIETCDNSGAKIIKIFTVVGRKTTKGKVPAAGIADLVTASVRRGRPDMRKQVIYAIIVRQKKEYRRADGTRIRFEDNSAVVLKDDKGNPKGTIFKGAIAKEVCERWPGIAKIASIVV